MRFLPEAADHIEFDHGLQLAPEPDFGHTWSEQISFCQMVPFGFLNPEVKFCVETGKQTVLFWCSFKNLEIKNNVKKTHQRGFSLRLQLQQVKKMQSCIICDAFSKLQQRVSQSPNPLSLLFLLQFDFFPRCLVVYDSRVCIYFAQKIQGMEAPQMVMISCTFRVHEDTDTVK